MQLRHPNIVIFIGATWDTYSNVGFVLECVDRGDLWHVLRDKSLNLEVKAHVSLGPTSFPIPASLRSLSLSFSFFFSSLSPCDLFTFVVVAHPPFEYGGGYRSGHVLFTWTNTACPSSRFEKFEYFGDCHFQLQGALYISKKCSSNTSIGALYLSELALTRTLHPSTNLHLKHKPNSPPSP